MLIAQLSDLHIGVGRDLNARENFRRLQQALQTLENLSPEPDLVLVTGSLTQSASIDAYRLLQRIFEATSLQVWPCLGIHDRRYPFRKVFGKDYFDGDYVQYAVDAGELRIIAVDTLAEGVEGGSFSSAQAVWLDEVLSLAADRPTLIAQHHAPMSSDLADVTTSQDEPWMHRLNDVISRHPQVKKIMSGHHQHSIERPMAGLANTRLASNFAPRELAPEQSSTRIVQAPPAFSLHFWDGDEVITRQSTVGVF